MEEQLTFDDNDDLVRAWKNVQKRLAHEVPSAWMERFLKPLRVIGQEGGNVTICAPGKFVQEWVRERYLDTLQAMLSDEVGRPMTIGLTSETRDKPKPITSARPQAVTVNNKPTCVDAFKPNEKFTFHTFVRGQSNRLAVAGATAVAEQPGGRFNPLFIYGPSGLGKTHLLHAMAAEIQKKHQFTLVYVTAQQFAEEFVNALQTNRIEQFRKSQRSVGVWLVDDIQFVTGKEKTQEEFFHTFNYLQSLGKQIVVTADRPPRDLYSVDERLRSRFESGLVADVQMPDTETRCAIIQSKAKQEKIVINHETAMYLAEHVPGNIRALEGALTRLEAQASLEHGNISFELAAAMVEQHYRAAMFVKPSVEQIVEAVSKHFRIPVAEIVGSSRKAPIVHARHIAIYISREITRDSWQHIGSQFGDRDHTSIMHGHKKVEKLLDYDKDLKATVGMLLRDLNPGA
jgi:chromosomal replication initiator protein